MAAHLSFIVGIVGNLISILVFASPISTFWKVVKNKSTQNYEWLPYVTTLLATSLWTYYGLLKTDGLLIVTVNGAGSVMQSVYVVLFLVYSPRDTRVKMLKLVALLNVGLYGVVVLVTYFALHGHVRLLAIGCMCAALTVGMYAAPMAAMRLVVQSRSVEYMPFSLSFFLFLNGGAWSAYSVLVKDFFIGVPNAIGFILGTAQLILYAIYRRKRPLRKEEGVVVVDIEMAAKADNNSLRLRKVDSLPKPSVYRQRSLTKIVKSLSLPPYGSNWSEFADHDDQLPTSLLKLTKTPPAGKN